jgi:hypothetical protein
MSPAPFANSGNCQRAFQARELTLCRFETEPVLLLFDFEDAQQPAKSPRHGHG